MALNRNKIRALICIAVSAAVSLSLLYWAVQELL